MRIRRLLVPTDFSDISNAALNRAVKLAKQSDADLYHLHMVDSQDDVPLAREKLEVISRKVLVDHKIKIHNHIRIGGFMKSIGDVSCELNADLIIMGTHGIKGMQWLTGSNALKILSNSPTPILISQNADDTVLKHIVVPLDYRLETRQKLDATIQLASAYKSRIHLYVRREKDSLYIDKMNKMIKQVSSYISNHDLEYTLNYEDQPISSDRLLEFSYRVGADLVVIINYQEQVFSELFGATREQELITNKYKIPVLCVNAKKTAEIIVTY